jgi:hypothetical protein
MAIDMRSSDGTKDIVQAVFHNASLAREVNYASRRIVENEFLRAIAVPLDFAQLRGFQISEQKGIAGGGDHKSVLVNIRFRDLAAVLRS